MGALLGLVALIPGGGAVASIVGGIAGAILRCKPCLLVLALGAAFVWGDIHGHHKADAACAAKDVAMQLKAAQRDAAINADKVRFQQQQSKALAVENAELKRKYDDAMANSKGSACPLGADRADRLRDLVR